MLIEQQTERDRDMTQASACSIRHNCALVSALHDLNSNKDEDREESNRIEWEEIVESAELSGDSLDYDGPLTWAGA